MKPSPKAWLIGMLGGLAVGISVCHSLTSVTARPPVEVNVEENPHDLYQVVSDQITALRQHNYPAAYEFAASGIRAKFPVEKFAEMVRENYPQLVRPGSLNFANTQFVQGRKASLLIYLTSGKRSVPAIYTFVKENGKWKIEGVELVRGINPTLLTGSQRV